MVLKTTKNPSSFGMFGSSLSGWLLLETSYTAVTAPKPREAVMCLYFVWQSQLSSTFELFQPRHQTCEWRSLQMIPVPSSSHLQEFELPRYHRTDMPFLLFEFPDYLSMIKWPLFYTTEFVMVCYIVIIMNIHIEKYTFLKYTVWWTSQTWTHPCNQHSHQESNSVDFQSMLFQR